ncbi:hypothetical protein M0R45_026428 [Rubus argutus]|uniref:Uncharacterized protein n=1 Tax=Rubus argutus TaxID=59490 RepID=A0AAW1WXL1_RUBAR
MAPCQFINHHIITNTHKPFPSPIHNPANQDRALMLIKIRPSQNNQTKILPWQHLIHTIKPSHKHPPQESPPSSPMSFDVATSSIADVTLYSPAMTRSQAELRPKLQSVASSACCAPQPVLDAP